jgi:hypothetical protein
LSDAPAAADEPTLEITSVERLDTRAADPLLRFGIDRPAARSSHTRYDFVLSGWILHPERRVVSVQVLGGDEAIGWGHARHIRHDVERAFPNVAHARESGFHIAVAVIGLPAAFDAMVEATLADGRRIALARIHGTRSRWCPHEGAELRPVVVTSLGRSGSTYLLGLLAGHPEISVDPVVPYENRTSSYWLHLFKVLSRPANHARAGDLDTFAFSRHFVGQNPFNIAFPDEPDAMREWYGRIAVERLAAFCRQSIDSYYRQLGGTHHKTSPQYYAEKAFGSPLSHLWTELYSGGREIFLVRDFRDMVASILAFNAKRGHSAFSRERFNSDEEYVRWLGATGVREMQMAWQRRASGSLLVRYEDLVRDPEASLTAILAYVGLESSEGTVRAMLERIPTVAALRDHRTSQDAPSSIGRWRVDLDERLQEVCAEVFEPVLPDFGYAVPVA